VTAAAADVQKVRFAAVAGPYLPGKSAAVLFRGLFGLPEEQRFPKWFSLTPEQTRKFGFPWFPLTAKQLDGPGYEKVVSSGTGNERLPESVFAHGDGSDKKYEKRGTWLNTVSAPGEHDALQTSSKTVDEDESLIVEQLEREAEGKNGKGKTVVYVAFGSFVTIPLTSGDGNQEPYKRFLEDLLSLGEDFVVLVRVPWSFAGAPDSLPVDGMPKAFAKTSNFGKSKKVFLRDSGGKNQAKIFLYLDTFPQQALFASQRLQESRRLVFVTHGGASSISEALRARIPMVTVPAMIEQATNARLLQSNGLAVDASQAGFDLSISMGAPFPKTLILSGSFHSIAAAVSRVAEKAEEMRRKVDEFASAMRERSVTPKQLADLLATPSGH